MSFAIEVPGEATPLGLPDLFRTLSLAATAHDHTQRQSATQQLTTWESHEDYYPALQAVFLDKTLPREVRLLSVIQLKNGIDRYWRAHGPKNPIPPAKKDIIRGNLYQGTVGEEDKQLALHNALATAKVMRIDYPHDWPNALPQLIDLLRSTKDTNQLHLSGTLTILLRIVKELGTARLRKSQTALQAITPELVHVLGEVYGAKTEQWIAQLPTAQASDPDVVIAMHSSLTAFKILRRLLIVGYEYPDSDQAVQQVWSFSQTQFGQFFGFVSQESPIPAPLLEVVGKHLLQFTKLHIEMAEKHPASFVCLPSSLDLVRAYWDLVAKFSEVFDKSGGIRNHSSASSESDSKAAGPLLEKLALKGLIIMRVCVRMANQPHQTIKYRSKEVVQSQQEAINHIKTDLLTDDLVGQMASTIISRLFVFRKADLEAWETDPEEWEQQEDSTGNAYEWEVRPCSERLFLDLLTNYKRLLLQPLLAYFATAQSSDADIGTKDAVYTAMGLAAQIVYDEYNFESILMTTIVNDAQQTGSYAKILRRRIAILLGAWAPVTGTDDSRRVTYDIFRHFMNPEDPTNDIVVRITAARHFKSVADEFGFDGEKFLPFTPDILRELLNLLQQVEVDEAKLAILETTRVLIDRMDTHISQFGDYILTALPAIWDSAGELGLMLKQSVLSILHTLVEAMKSDFAPYRDKIAPLIADATREGTDLYVYLIEDALELWNSILNQSSTPLSKDLLDLAEPAISQLADQNENSFNLLTVVGSYICLAPETLLEDRFRQPLLQALGTALCAKSREQVAVGSRYVDTYLRYAHELGGTAGLEAVLKDMVQSGFLTMMLESIHDTHEANKTHGPNRRKPKINTITLMDYYAILSRIALLEPRSFVEILSSLGPLEQTWEWLSTEWFGNLDSVADIARKKLNLMGMTRFLELPSPMHQLTLAKLQDYFAMWTCVMAQLLEDENPGVDRLLDEFKAPDEEYMTAKDNRQKALYQSDPIRTVHCLEFVKERLQAVVERCGGEQAFQETWAINVDKDVLAGFQALGTPRDSN